MAAKSLESSNKTWQRVRIALDAAGANEATRRLFRELKQYLSTFAGNPQLQFVSFSDVTTDQVTAIDSGGCTIYGLFLKKQNTATDAYFKANDHATLAGGANGANVKMTLPLLVGKDEVAVDFLPGLIFATGIVVASETTAAGGADTTSGDGPNGFFIVG